MKGKDITENISELAEAWYNGEFDLGYYNFYICTTTDGLIQKCKDEHKIKVTRSDIENMCKLDLLEYILDKKDRKKMFPQFIADRVAFIKELQAKSVPVIVDLSPDDLDEFIETMDPHGLFMWVATEDESEELEILKRIESWS